MTEPSLAAQRLAVASLRAHAPLTSLVPAANILDKSSRPEVFPCIIVGEGQTVGDEADCVYGADVYLDFHCWARENGLTAVKEIASEVRRGLRGVEAVQDGHSITFTYESTTFLRDPDGEHSHAVASLLATTEEVA